jgi:hypothetical protein
MNNIIKLRILNKTEEGYLLPENGASDGAKSQSHFWTNSESSPDAQVMDYTVELV